MIFQLSASQTETYTDDHTHTEGEECHYKDRDELKHQETTNTKEKTDTHTAMIISLFCCTTNDNLLSML